MSLNVLLYHVDNQNMQFPTLYLKYNGTTKLILLIREYFSIDYSIDHIFW